jgi:hypothetical protein
LLNDKSIDIVFYYYAEHQPWQNQDKDTTSIQNRVPLPQYIMRQANPAISHKLKEKEKRQSQDSLSKFQSGEMQRSKQIRSYPIS